MAEYHTPPMSSIPPCNMKRSPLLSPGAPLFESNYRNRRPSLVVAVPPTPASAFFDAEEFGAPEDEDANEGSAAVSSGTDTTGPGTPATPSWKPRELTLLRMRAASDEAQGQETANGRSRKQSRGAVDGLAIEGLEMQGLNGEHALARSNEFRNNAASSKSSPVFTTPSLPSLHAPMPRELMLSASDPVTSSKRVRDSSSAATLKSSIPVRRGPAFTAKSSPILPSKSKTLLTEVQRMRSPSVPQISTSSGKLLKSPTTQSCDAEPSTSALFEESAMKARSGSSSFKEAMETVGARRKGAPAPLNLSHGSKSAAACSSDALSRVARASPKSAATDLLSSSSEDGWSGSGRRQRRTMQLVGSSGRELSPFTEPIETDQNTSVDSDLRSTIFKTPQQSPSVPLRGAVSPRARHGLLEVVAETPALSPDQAMVSPSASFLAPPSRLDRHSVASTNTGDESSIMTRHDTPSCDSVRPFEYEASSTASHSVTHATDESSDPATSELNSTVDAEQCGKGIISTDRDLQNPVTPTLAFNTEIFSQATPTSERGSILPRDSSLPRSRRSPRSPAASSKTEPASPSRYIPDSHYLSAAQLHARRQEPEQTGSEELIAAEGSSSADQGTTCARTPSQRIIERRSRELLQALQIPTAEKLSLSLSIGPNLLKADKETAEITPRQCEIGIISGAQVNCAQSPPVSPMQTTRSRMIAVPDVPAFSFTLQSSPLPADSARATPTSLLTAAPIAALEEVQQGVSHWSSGSEDEGDKAGGKVSARRTSKKSLQGRRSSPGSGSTTPTVKRSAFLTGLSLRKKSLTGIRLASNELPGSSANSQCSDSPSASKFDFIEFPFPKQSRPSFSFGRPSRPSISGPASGKSISSFSHSRSESSMSRTPSCATEASTPVDCSPNVSRMSTQKSESSLRAAAATQMTSVDLKAVSPTATRGIDSPMRHQQEVSLAPSPTTTKNPSSKSSDCVSPQSKTQRRQTSLQSFRSSESLRPRASTVSRIDEGSDEALQRRSLLRFSASSQRKRSLTLDTSLRSSTFARDVEYARMFDAPQKRLASLFADTNFDAPPSNKSDPMLRADSPSATPRARQTPLESAPSIDGSFTDKSRRDTDDDSAFLCVGQALVGRPSRRVRHVEAQAKPRYPSLTDIGRQWLAAHPEQAFAAALGPALLEWTLSQSSSQDGASSGSNSMSKETDSGTDEYGSSNGRSSEEQGGNTSSNASGTGGDDGPNSQDASFRPAATDVDAESSDSDSDDASSSSSDSYGASENDLPAVDMSRLESQQSRAAESTGDVSSASSDDAPLGQKLRELQADMPRRSKSQGKTKTKEVPSSFYSAPMNVNQLDARLQGLQRAQTMNASTSRDSTSRPREATRLGTQSASLHRSRRTDLEEGRWADKTGFRSKQLPQATEQVNLGKGRTGDVVADFAETVRARSRSRINLRPTAIDVSRNDAIPALPRAYQSAVNNDILSSNSSLASLAEQQTSKLNVSQTMSPDQRSPTAFSPAETAALTAKAPVEMVLHRVYVGGQQRYTTVSIASTARVLDLLSAVLKKESMQVEGQSSGWAVYDVCSSLKLERPLREYETLHNVITSRTSKTDSFMMRRTDLSPYLNQQSVPTAAPSVAGYVYIQDNSKKRSWSKRWLELRNNALYHSKSDKARHPTQLCHLSSFDMYTPQEGALSSFHAPKRNVFALRSIDAVHLFEDPEKDYAFYFSLTDDNAARQWITSLLRARSFVLKQEKATLFRTPTATQAGVPTLGRYPATAPAKPLLSFAAEHYEKGSLLEQQQQQLAESQRVPSGSPGLRTAPLSELASPSTRTQPSQPSPLGGHPATAVSPDGQVSAQAGNVRRHEEVVQAERRVRMDGKPLIGLVDDMSRFKRAAPGTVLEASYEAAGSSSHR